MSKQLDIEITANKSLNEENVWDALQVMVAAEDLLWNQSDESILVARDYIEKLCEPTAQIKRGAGAHVLAAMETVAYLKMLGYDLSYIGEDADFVQAINPRRF